MRRDRRARVRPYPPYPRARVRDERAAAAAFRATVRRAFRARFAALVSSFVARDARSTRRPSRTRARSRRSRPLDAISRRTRRDARVSTERRNVTFPVPSRSAAARGLPTRARRAIARARGRARTRASRRGAVSRARDASSRSATRRRRVARAAAPHESRPLTSHDSSSTNIRAVSGRSRAVSAERARIVRAHRVACRRRRPRSRARDGE